MLETALVVFKFLPVPGLLVAIGMWSLISPLPLPCQQIEGMVSARHVTLSIKNGGTAHDPRDAVFVQLPTGEGLYSDKELSCKLVMRVGTTARGSAQYTNPERTLTIFAGPGKDALKVVYGRDTAHYWRATASAH